MQNTGDKGGRVGLRDWEGRGGGGTTRVSPREFCAMLVSHFQINLFSFIISSNAQTDIVQGVLILIQDVPEYLILILIQGVPEYMILILIQGAPEYAVLILIQCVPEYVILILIQGVPEYIMLI